MITRTFDSKLDWLEWRKKGVCASDVAAILGKSKWKTIDQLFIEKTGELNETKDNWAMAKGREYEPIIRSRLEKDYNCSLEVLCGENYEKSWIRASFDGINFNEGLLVEIKTAGKEDHALARSGRVPDKYFPQLQWQLYVSGFRELRYISAHENKETGWEIQEVIVHYDKSYIDEIMPQVLRFWNCVQTGVPPTDPLSEDIAKLFDEYSTLWNTKAQVDERMKVIRNLIADITPADGSLSHAGFKGQWRVRQGTVDYKSVPQLFGVDLDQYRKEEVAYFDLRRAD